MKDKQKKLFRMLDKDIDDMLAGKTVSYEEARAQIEEIKSGRVEELLDACYRQNQSQIDYKGAVEYARAKGKTLDELSYEEKYSFFEKVPFDSGREEAWEQCFREAYADYVLRRWKAIFEVYRKFRFKYGMSVEHMLKLLAKDEGITEEEARVLYEEHKKQWDKEPKTFTEKMAQECGVPLIELSGQNLDKKVYLMASGMADSCYIVLEMEYGKAALCLFNYLRIKTVNRGVELRIEESLDLNDVPYEIVSEETFIATVEKIW